MEWVEDVWLRLSGVRLGERERIIAALRRWAAGLEAPVTAVLVGSHARGDFNL